MNGSLQFNLETIKKYLRIDRQEICFLRFVFEAYDGIATITTVDPEQGVVLLQIAPGCEEEVAMVLKDLEKQVLIQYDIKLPQGQSIPP